MKQLFFKGGKPVIADISEPGLEAGRIQVAVEYSAVSPGTERSLLVESGRSFLSRVLEKRHRLDRLWSALRRRDLREIQMRLRRLQSRSESWLAPGYSAAGTVRAVGVGVDAFAPGDRVAVAGAGYAGHGEVITAPRNLAVRVPDGLDLQDASTVAVGAIALQAVRRADARIGETVLVLGLGLLGQFVTRILLAAGCRVVGWDPLAARRSLAETQGVEILRAERTEEVAAALAPLTAGRGADAVILAAAAGEAAVEAAAAATRHAGTLVLLGDAPVRVTRETAYARELTMRMSTSYGPGRYDPRYEEEGHDYPFAHVRWTENRNMGAWLELLAAKKVAIDDLIQTIRSLEEAAEAYVALRQGTLDALGLVFRHAADGTVGGAAATGDALGTTSESIATATPERARSAGDHDRLVGTPLARGPRTPPLRLALLGTGAYARGGLLPAAAAQGDRVRFELLAGTVPARREPLAQQYGFVRTASSYEKAASDPQVDLVAIVTRHDRRAELIVPALEAGHAVFCEKPLALTDDGLDLIESGLARSGGFLTMGFNRRFAPAMTRLRAELAGRTGPLQMSYRVQAGPLPEDHWIRGPQGGGRLIGEGVHMIDLLRFLAGAPLTQAWVVAGGANAQADASADPAADNFQIGLQYADGSTASLLYTSRGAREHSKERLEVHVDGRSLELDNFQVVRESGRSRPLWEARAPQKGQPELWRAMVDALLDGSESPTSADEVLETSRATLALERMRRGE
ncbi:MAG: Gfo/Idh/MocA family oxidoreductase [Candidatus Eisenbacteria sp.]|nr:Gfo/Idh/MocA family oxidoreductase [Candidatus Eisenbacteria bacterium]